jgi:hypothetical protein
MSLEQTEKFKKGLLCHNLTINDIINSGFKYCGGDTGRHLNYYKLIYGNNQLTPKKEEKCFCGHIIKENCYITDRIQLLTLGNCCIKKFLDIDKSGRTCEKCENTHKNRKINICNDCKNLKKEKEKYDRKQKKEKEKYDIEQQEIKERVYLCVNYYKKDEAKELGAKWDSETMLWYAPNLTYKELIERFE